MMDFCNQIKEYLLSHASSVIDNLIANWVAYLISLLIMPSLFFYRKMRVTWRQRKLKTECAIKNRRNQLRDILQGILDKGEEEIQRQTVLLLAEYDIISADGIGQDWITNRAIIGRFLERIASDKRIRALLKDAVQSNELIRRLLDLSRPSSPDVPARAFINSCGEKIDPNYEAANDEQQSLSDLEKECLNRIISQVSAWRDSEDGQKAHMHEDGCRVLLMGGMRAIFASRIIEAFAIQLGCRLFVCTHKESVSQEQIDAMRKFASDEKGQRIGITVVSDNDADAKTGYDIIVCTHYWQHRDLEDFSKAKFHLRDDGGLLIWFSALSRGCDASDVECVCEGMPPLEPNPVEDEVVLPSGESSPCGVIIPYTRMDGFGLGKGKICYSPLEDGVWGCKFFYEKLFPRWFQADKNDLDNDFCGVTLEFLRWYFLEDKVCIGEKVSEISSMEANVEGKEKFNDARYVVCSVGYDLNDGYGKRQQYLLATISIPDRENMCLVTLYPCVKDKPCVWSALLREKLSNLLSKKKFSDLYESDSRQYNFCDDNNLVCKVVSKIKCPESKHYMFYLDVSKIDSNGSILYRTCIPFRTYLPVSGYDKVRQEIIIKYDSRIKKFRGEHSSSRFLPCRKDAVTILRPYYEIKNTLQKSYSVFVDEQTIFFHKCFGRVEDEDIKKLQLEKIGSSVIDALMSSSVNISKDKAFNELPLGKRLEMLGGMNVHDVLLFGVKHGRRG